MERTTRGRVMTTSFAEIFRPKTSKQLIGETQIKSASALLKRVTDKNILREVMFSGPSGIGKTTISRMYIQSIIGGDKRLEEYVQTINCSSDTGIDNIRVIIDSLQFIPFDCDYKIFFLEEFHGLSKQAQNALLVEVEPLPDHVIMIASTTEADKIIPTLRSRFTEYRLAVPTNEEFKTQAVRIATKFKDLSKIENSNGYGEQFKRLKEAIDSNTIDEIILSSRGNVRTFIRLLESIADGSYKPYTENLEDENNLVSRLFNQKMTLAQWCNACDKEDYHLLSVGICNYAIKVLQNNNGNNGSGIKSKKALQIFGDGLSNNTSPRVNFYSKLIEWHDSFPH
jgi:replication-associated recombination protein RarA